MEGYPQSGPRAILNANRGVSNVIEQRVINTDLRRVTDDIFRVLMHHYGPHSGFAALDDAQPLNETNFTKDGIGIVRAIEYASPQEEWVRKTIAYIGTRMESGVGDGTTSAMMFTCAMLRHMSEHIDELRPLSYNKFRESFDRFIELVKEYETRYCTYSPFRMVNGKEELNLDAVQQIVYNQTYTSSHGNKKLAKALADLYRKTPKELWERMTYERRRYESDEPFEVVGTEGQYQMAANVMNPAMLNREMGSWYENQNCTVVIANDSLRIDSVDWPAIENLIKEATTVRPVVIISHNIADDASYERISTLDADCARNGNPFAVFQAKPEHPQINDFAALQLLANIDVYKLNHGQVVILDGCHVKFKNKKLSIDGIYEEPEGYTALERPMVTDGQHGVFTDHLEAWERQAKLYSDNAQDQENRRWATYYNRMYVKLRYSKVYNIVIGGKSYDNVAFVDVLDDAIRAASRALVNGATYGNNRALYLAVSRMIEAYDSPNLSTMKKACSPTVIWFARRVKESLEDLAKVVLKREHPHNKLCWLKSKDFVKWWFGHAVDLLHYEPKPVLDRFCLRPWEYQFSRPPSTEHHDMKKMFDLDGFICQPVNSDIIMLERFGEIALKFILTERVIIHGGAYVDKKRK